MSQSESLKKSRAKDKMARIPIKIQPAPQRLKKPDWIRVKASTDPKVAEVKTLLRQNQLFSVCEEASCPNLSECFSKGTATFMIMGDKCTRRCTFCDVAHGRPDPLDQNEPKALAKALAHLNLNYIVITSVDRDDLLDGGATHFAQCIQNIRQTSPNTKIEILVPDFRGRLEKALQGLSTHLPDVFNHNLETVPRLYRQARPGSDYQWSLSLIDTFKSRFGQNIPCKSGLMVGLGETDEEIIQVMEDLRQHQCDWLTIGQYLQPSIYHLPVDRYVTPKQFEQFKTIAQKLGFTHVASGPMVRSSYHADKQAAGETVC